jgi:hypothetical protein
MSWQWKVNNQAKEVKSVGRSKKVEQAPTRQRKVTEAGETSM